MKSIIKLFALAGVLFAGILSYAACGNCPLNNPPAQCPVPQCPAENCPVANGGNCPVANGEYCPANDCPQMACPNKNLRNFGGHCGKRMRSANKSGCQRDEIN